MVGSVSCDLCGERIEAGSAGVATASSARYCSNACRQRAYRRRLKTNWLGIEPSADLLTQLSSFVGRADDLVELGRLLRTVRLLTLTGPAGAGKTRLAVELAKQERHRDRGEIVMVELASVSRGGAARHRIAAGLGLNGSARESPVRLAVLDNCEHVLDECGTLLGEVLSRCPGLRILATSREPLRIPGETVYAVGGLSVLPPAEQFRAADYLRSPAVRLFLDRARAAAPGFQVSDDVLARISAICHQLDGLPLAIEFAARLARALPLAEIHDRLDDRLALFVDGWRTADPRHQSWRKAVEWSYELLTPAEQSLFRRLSVLPGGFGADTAAAVAAGEDVPVSAIPELLVAIEAKSMIRSCVGRQGENAARFEMLQSIRCYGYEQLGLHGEEKPTHERLVAWLVELARPLLVNAIIPPEALARLSEERENLRRALDWTNDREDERALLLAGTLVAVETRRESSAEIEPLVRQALRVKDPWARHRSIALEGAAALAVRRGDHERALRFARQAVDAECGSGHDPLLSRLLLRLSQVETHRGSYRAALGHLWQCLAISRECNDSLMTAICLGVIAGNLMSVGALGPASRLIEGFLPTVRAKAPPTWSAVILHIAGALALERGDLPLAERYFADSLRCCVDNHAVAPLAMEGLSIVAIGTSRFERGLRLLAASEALRGPALGGSPWWCDRLKTACEKAVESLSPFRAEAALASGRAMKPRQAVDYALGSRGSIPGIQAGNDPLTLREWEVIMLVVKGLTNRQIAARMHLSIRTVEAHLRNIRVVLGLRSRAHVAAWGARTVSQR